MAQTARLARARTVNVSPLNMAQQIVWASCSGAGGAVTGTGTSGAIAKFTGSSVIADSLLSESGSVVTLAGTKLLRAPA